ncbi:hypothetical protein CKAH01_02578 [Colletotrichum kahawae]|uniref:Uncharacterized protein n=1 Tax=Colletotrichum kahawae TaxID=34407 RepID=A0AAD9XWQ1_COLKA|nr:hypothetical protein CKAH01_02578 [Colletotrichum kahawae]
MAIGTSRGLELQLDDEGSHRTRRVRQELEDPEHFALQVVIRSDAALPWTNGKSVGGPGRYETPNHHCQHHTSHFVADFRAISHFNTLLSATLKLSKNAPTRISILSSESGISLAKRRLSADDNIASHLPVHA